MDPDAYGSKPYSLLEIQSGSQSSNALSKMIFLLIPVALFLLPYCAVRATEGLQHTFMKALVYAAAAMGSLFVLVAVENGIDPPDGEIGARILAPYFVISIPLAIAAVGVAGWVRWLRNGNARSIN